MIASFLQDDLANELIKIFDGFKLHTPAGDLSNINIFKQLLPMPEASDQGDILPEQLENGLVNELTELDPYPYVLVRVSDGEIADEASAQTINVMLLMGVYDYNFNKNGHKDIMNMIQKIYERFAKVPVLCGRYTIQYPISWTLQEEESYPFYFGGMNLIWETAAVRRENKFA